MPHSNDDSPAIKRQRLNSSNYSPSNASNARQSSIIFSPFRVVGLVSPTSVPFTSLPLGKTTFQITTSVGRALQTYDLRRGLNLVFVSRPQTPFDITATLAWKDKVYAAWGGDIVQEPNTYQGIWIFQRGKKVGELQLPRDLEQPITQMVAFGQWLVACALTRVEVWKSDTLEHYTTIYTMASRKGDNELTGGVTTMPTFLNKIFLGRRDGWVEIWNVSTGKLIYTILPPSPDYGAVSCMEPSPALFFMAIAYTAGPLIIHNVLTDKTVLQVDAGSSIAPVSSIAFRTDGAGAGQDGRKDGVMATATIATGDVTFWDLNEGGRVMGVLRSAHNPPSRDHVAVSGGVSKVEFLSGQSIIITSGRDNSLKSWIFDQSPFSPIPRILHSRSGHAGPVNCLQFLPSDFDGADAGNKWLMSGGRDRSLWAWSLRRDGQSSELSQGNIRKKAKKYGLLATNVLGRGPTTNLEDIKAPAITCMASSLNRDGGIGALPGKQQIWQKRSDGKAASSAEISGMTGWESVVTGHENDQYARTWFWGRKRAGRWALPTGDKTNVSTVAMTACGNFALVGSAGGMIDMYNLQSGQHRQRFPAKLTPAQARQLKMQQLKQVDAVARLQIQSGAVLTRGVGKHAGAVTGVSVDTMNKSVISCGLDGKVKFWDFITGNLTKELDWPVPVTASRYHAPNDLMAFSCDDRSIRVVDIETRRTIREFRALYGSVSDFCFSSDGRWIIAASREDCMVRIFDLPTGHLIDAIRLRRPCLSVAMSTTGEYLATVVEGELGVGVWTNRTLFKRIPTKRISEASMLEATGPTASGEGGQGLVAASAEDIAASDDGQSETLAPAVEQLSADMMTLSVMPKNRWQTLIHLDLIKQRNKPTEPAKVPEQAPFFLPSLPGQASNNGEKNDNDKESESRITQFDRSRSRDTFTDLLRSGATSNNYNAFIEHLKSLAPSSADLELRSLSPGEGDGDTNELLHFIRALTDRLAARRDYELTQAWMTVFLRLHSEMILESQLLLKALDDWREHQDKVSARLDELVGYCSGVIGFLRSPRV